MKKLLSDPDNHQESAAMFITERDKYVLNNMSVANYAALTSSLIWAVVGNTMPTCYWALYFLVADKEAMAAIRREVDQVAATNNTATDPSGSGLAGARTFSQLELDQMTMLSSVVHEALRLTSGSIVMRVASEDLALKWKGMANPEGPGWNVRAGDRVCFYPPLHHHDRSRGT